MTVLLRARPRHPFAASRGSGGAARVRSSTIGTVPRAPPRPEAPFAVLQTVEEVRRWRMERLLRGETVGFVPTMGNLHEGHLNLARHSLSRCDHTVASIFVNPAQFAPHEDLATYPRTLAADIGHLASLAIRPDSLSVPKSFDTLSTIDSPSTPPSTPQAPLPPPSEPDLEPRRVSALFLPSVGTLYPSGIEQDVSKQRGTFVEVKGFSHQMEGRSRPTFFRGVATVVLKLFNIVRPDKAFFGQKDIQQCLVLRQLLRDLHLPHPPSPSSLIIIPTSRDPTSGLALSSRNNYLTPPQRKAAVCLSQALFAAKAVYLLHKERGEPAKAGDLIEAAETVIEDMRKSAAGGEGGEEVDVKLDYIAVNDPVDLKDLDVVVSGRGAIVSGAVWCGKTRLIDNIVVDYDLNA